MIFSRKATCWAILALILCIFEAKAQTRQTKEEYIERYNVDKAVVASTRGALQTYRHRPHGTLWNSGEYHHGARHIGVR